MAITAIGDEIDGEIRLRCIKGQPEPPHYTLNELKQLAREYVSEAVNRTTDQLVLSLFLAWLAQRERGKE